MPRGVCIWGARCIEGKTWQMGADSEEKAGGNGRARVQRAVIIREGSGSEGLKLTA